jgi:hypothetical protein
MERGRIEHPRGETEEEESQEGSVKQPRGNRPPDHRLHPGKDHAEVEQDDCGEGAHVPLREVHHGVPGRESRSAEIRKRIAEAEDGENEAGGGSG